MPDEPTPAALTDQQIVERLAKFMGWKWRKGWNDIPGDARRIFMPPEEVGKEIFRKHFADATGDELLFGDWDRYLDQFRPLKDWNHWRQVEEKVMEDQQLTIALYKVLMDMRGHTENVGDNSFDIWNAWVRYDLPTRCKALLSALDSLPTHAN